MRKKLRIWLWWWKWRHKGRFMVKECRLQALSDGTLLVTSVDGGPIAVWIDSCVLDGREIKTSSFFAGDYDIDRLLASDAPVKLLVDGPTDDIIDRELDSLR